MTLDAWVILGSFVVLATAVVVNEILYRRWLISGVKRVDEARKTEESRDFRAEVR